MSEINVVICAGWIVNRLKVTLSSCIEFEIIVSVYLTV